MSYYFSDTTPPPEFQNLIQSSTLPQVQALRVVGEPPIQYCKLCGNKKEGPCSFTQSRSTLVNGVKVTEATDISGTWEALKKQNQGSCYCPIYRCKANPSPEIVTTNHKPALILILSGLVAGSLLFFLIPASKIT